MRISDLSSDVCSSDLPRPGVRKSSKGLIYMKQEQVVGKPKAKAGSDLWDSIRTLVYAILIAVGIRTFAYEPFHIPSASMYPTLLIADYVFVAKFSYGYSKYSLLSSPPLFSGRILGYEPKRGDVVGFRFRSAEHTSELP